jgi:hypothetical protein
MASKRAISTVMLLIPSTFACSRLFPFDEEKPKSTEQSPSNNATQTTQDSAQIKQDSAKPSTSDRKAQEAQESILTIPEASEVVLTLWSSIPSCNGFKIKFNREAEELTYARCEKDSLANTYGSWPLTSTVKLSSDQVTRASEIVSKLKGTQKSQNGTSCGISGGFARFTIQGKTGEPKTLLADQYFCFEDKSSVPVEDSLFENVKSELFAFAEELVNSPSKPANVP